MEFPTDRHGLIHRSAALTVGLTDTDLVRACRRGDLTRVIRGVYVASSRRTPEEVHRLRAIASVQMEQVDRVRSVVSPVRSEQVVVDSDAAVEVGAGVRAAMSRTVLSHQSAAAVHGLSMLKPNFRRVHFTTREKSGGYRTPSRHVHVGGADDVVETDGIRMTSLARTAVDVACSTTMGFAGALTVFDSALRLGADREAMGEMLRGRRKGVGVARRALHHADGLAENPGESWSRAQMIEAGFPVPRLQHEFFDGAGDFVARTDFDRSGLLVGEFDGKAKYRKNLRPGETPLDALQREEEREDALRRLGIMVIRWTWDDLEHGRLVGMIRDWLVRLRLLAA
ncbi:hypothetical protein AAFP35_25885 [Gordonia sp. CPCC 206044]|uniref:hypothetical protein n=1 Tax=Gordonia sp. CPCC 206044 TaxID=3140793 RepID=UPI003AF38274